ncbi:MAG: GntR family transcriptional regulator [Halanaerobiaceae bacterium]
MVKEPLYTKVQKKLFTLIKNENISNPLPSENKLAEKFDVSRQTVREAIRALVNSGILYKKHGVGTFIKKTGDKNENLILTGLEELRGIQNIIRDMDRDLDYKKQEIDVINATEKIAENLQSERNEEVLKIEQVYLADRIPIVIGESYIQPQIPNKSFFNFGKEVIQEANKGKSLFEVLEEKTGEGVKTALAKIIGISADKKRAEILEIDINTPLILLEEIHSNKNGFPLIYSRDYINTKKFDLYIHREKNF